MVLMTRPRGRAAEQAGAAQSVQLVRFAAGGTAVALPLDRVAEVVALAGVAAGQVAAPRGWVGTLVRNARPVPVADLAYLLGLPGRGPASGREGAGRAILLRDRRAPGSQGVARFGVAGDDAPTMLAAPRVDFRPLPPAAGAAARALVAAVLVHSPAEGDESDAELTYVLDAATILAALEPGVARGPGGAVTGLQALPGEPDPGLVAERVRGRDDPLDALGTAPGQAPDWPQRVLALAPVAAGDGADLVVPAVPLDSVREVVEYRGATAMPHAPGALVGLAVWRGRALPVVDLGRRLVGSPSGDGAPAGNRLLIIGPPDGEPLGALLTPGVRGLLTLDARQGGHERHTPKLPAVLDRALVAAAVPAGSPGRGETVAIVDLAALLR